MTIRAEGLTVRYRVGGLRRYFTALDSLDLEVREGDFLALLGQNGAGKTTAMHAFLGLIQPSAGRVEVFGQRPDPGAAIFRQIGYLPEEPRYHEYLTIEEAVTYYARLSGLQTPQARVARVLEQLALAEHRRTRIRRCSKGMKQKVGIAQCIIHEPRLLLLDEPMRGLDPLTVHLFRDMLLEMHRNGVTIVMNSHLLGEAELVANRVAIIERGRLVVHDDTATLLRRSTNRYAVTLEGSEIPPHLQDAAASNGSVTGTLAGDDFYEFMDYTRARGVRVVSCALEKRTLEASFVEIVRGGAAHA